MDSATLMLNDFVSLPIIISDRDARSTESESSTSEPTSSAQTKRRDSFQSFRDPLSFSAQTNWSTGFGCYVDDIFSRMTDGMKQKVREACFEVLRRTDSRVDNGAGFGAAYDEDARLLD